MVDEPSRSASSMSDARGELADAIATMLKIEGAKQVILGAMADYDISRREKAVILYDGGQTAYYISRFIIAKRVAGCTERTCKSYSRILEMVFRFIGKSPVETAHTDIQKYLASLIVRNTSKSWQQTVHHTLSSFYAWMTREELISKNIMFKVDPVKCQPPHKTSFSDMEVEKIRAACRTKRETAVVEVLLSTGLRVFECGKVRIDEINEDQIEVIGKGEKPRTVYLNAKAQIAIASYLAERKDKNPYLFPASVKADGQKGTLKRMERWYTLPENVSADRHQDNSGLEAMIRGIGKRAGVENCHPHRFRRTCATMALRRGMPVTLVQLMLGHTNISTTQRYLDIKSDELKSAHKKFVL